MKQCCRRGYTEVPARNGYHGAYPSVGLNKMVAAKLNDTIHKQVKGLTQLSASASV